MNELRISELTRWFSATMDMQAEILSRLKAINQTAIRMASQNNEQADERIRQHEAYVSSFKNEVLIRIKDLYGDLPSDIMDIINKQ